MSIKLVFFYTQPSSGFSETYYTSGDNAKGVVDALPKSLFKRMSDWRAPACRLVAVRGSVVNSPHKSYVKTLYGDYAGVPSSGDPSLSLPDVQSTCAVVRLNGVSGKTRRVYLRGLKDSSTIMTAEGFPNPSPGLFVAWNYMVTEMRKAGFQIRWNDKTPLAPPLPAPTQVIKLHADALDPYFSEVWCNPVEAAKYARGG